MTAPSLPKRNHRFYYLYDVLHLDVLSHFTGPIIRMSLPSMVVSTLTSTTSRSGPEGLIRSQLEPVGFCARFFCTKSTGMPFLLAPWSFLWCFFSLYFPVMPSNQRVLHSDKTDKLGFLPDGCAGLLSDLGLLLWLLALGHTFTCTFHRLGLEQCDS